MRLKGKRALIVGASSLDSMGAHVARRFLEEGASVVLAGHNLDRTTAVGSALQVRAVELDLADEASLGRGVSSAADILGGIDIAINLAGANRAALIADETLDGLTRQAMLHFVGTALFIRDVAAVMTGAGAITTVSSVTAELTGARLAAYAGSKAAADKVVKVAALEYGDRGIRVNSLAPGLTHTPMTDAYFGNPAVVAGFTREIPLGRLPTVADVANAAVWVSSDECFQTGDVIRVSGGAHLRRLPTPADFTL